MKASKAAIALVFALQTGIAGSAAAACGRLKIAFFEKTIRPILINRCYECHSVESGKSKGGLLLDSRDAMLKGGDNGPGHRGQSRQEPHHRVCPLSQSGPANAAQGRHARRRGEGARRMGEDGRA
jgi:hypothetical protein